MIRVVDELPYNIVAKSDRRRKIVKDFDEIIKNRVHYCEIVDSGYQVSSIRDVGLRVAHQLSLKYSGRFDASDAFTFHIIKNSEGKPCFFVEFDVEYWDRVVNREKEG